jgi:hypothetical protein
VHNVGLYNIPHYAFGRVMWPGLAADDGTGVAAAAASGAAYWALMTRGQAAPPFGEDLARLGVQTRRWRTARLESPAGLQVDGDTVDGSEVELQMAPAALRVIGIA